MPYLFSTAIQIRQQFGTYHAARYLQQRGAPLPTALLWLLHARPA